MENVPEKIYLQIGEDADVTIDNSVNDFNDLFASAITWCKDRINENDIEYVRADLCSHDRSGLNKPDVTNRDLELRGADLWACCRNDYVEWMTLSYTRNQSIKNHMNGINPKLNWRYFKRRGWACIKIHVSFNHS